MIGPAFQRLTEGGAAVPGILDPPREVGPPVSNFTPEAYRAAVETAYPRSHPKFAELSLTTPIDLLAVDGAGLDKIFAKYPSFVESTMPKAPYKGVDGGFRAIGGAVILVAKKDLSDEAAYSIVKSFYEGLDGIKADMKQLKEATFKAALSGNKGLPVHPGAAKYYKEKGLM